MTLKHKILFLLLCFFAGERFYAQLNLLFDSSNIQLKLLNINTDEAEFGPFKIGNTIYYTSSQERKIGVINMEANTMHQMLDLYSGTLTDSITVKKTHPLPDRINTSMNQGSCFFERETSKLYYSTDVKIPGTDRHKLGIYSSELKNGQFEMPKPEMVLADTFSASHPFIFDHKLYFSANLPGGKGKTDIYIAEYKDTSWKIFTNFVEINTPENEYFPFVISDHEIYYSSNQEGGYGKLDIYKFSKTDSSTLIQNLGSPINSASDDFGIYIDSLEENGYFSSDRYENQDDIFYFNKAWPTFKNCTEQVKEDYCYNLSEESTLNTDSLKGYYYEWLFGDGTKQRGLEVRHCFLGPGNYMINLNVIDSTTKQVFMTQASFDLTVDSIAQLKINSLDTVLVGKDFSINTIGTFLPDKKILGYFFEIENKKIRGRSLNYKFNELGVHQVKLGIEYNTKKNPKKQLMCTTKNIVVVNAKTWAEVEKRKIAEEIAKYGYNLVKGDTSSLKDLPTNDQIAFYAKMGLNGKKVTESIKAYIEDRRKNGWKPEEISGPGTVFSSKYKFLKSDLDTLFDLKEAEGVTFKVHLGKSKNPKDTTAISANGLTGINMQMINGEYQYTYGNEKKINDIEKYYRQTLKEGIDNPVVIAYKNDVIIEDQSKNIRPATFYEDKSRIKAKPLTAESNSLASNGNNDPNLSGNVPSNGSDEKNKVSTLSTETNSLTNGANSDPNLNSLPTTNRSEINKANTLATETNSLSNGSNTDPNLKGNSGNVDNERSKANTLDADKSLLANADYNDPNLKGSKKERPVREKPVREKPTRKIKEKKDDETEMANTSGDINEALSGGSDFVPKTDVQKKILLYLKKYGDISAKDLEFKVQVGVYRHRRLYNFPKLRGLGNVETESLDDGLTRFTIGGSFKTLKDAFELNKRVFKAGHEDAFVSVYYKGKRIYIENLEKRGVIKMEGEETIGKLASIDENSLIEKTESKPKRTHTKPEKETTYEAENSPKVYDTKDFVPTTVVQRKTMAYVEKYGDKVVEGLEYKVQIALFKYRKDWDFPRLNKLGLGAIENAGIENGITRMTIGGSYKTLREAFEQNKKVILAGQSDAFVVVFYHGQRIYMENLEKKGVFATK